MNDNIPLFAAAAGILGLLIAYALYKKVNDVKIDNKTVGDITQEIQDGAMAFLKAEYKVLAVFVIIVAILLAFAANSQGDSPLVSISFLVVIAIIFSESFKNSKKPLLNISVTPPTKYILSKQANAMRSMLNEFLISVKIKAISNWTVNSKQLDNQIGQIGRKF